MSSEPDNNIPTMEEIMEMNKEVTNEINNIGDVEIPQAFSDKEQLDNLRKIINQMPREKVMDLLSNLARGDNSINPNENTFATTTEKDIRQRSLKHKIQQKRFDRMPKKSQQVMYQKQADKKKNNDKQSCCDGENCTHEHEEDEKIEK